MMVLVRIMQGAVAVLLFRIILFCIRKRDVTHGLPQKVSFWAMISPFACGFCLYTEEAWSAALLVMYIAYLAAMAYTDYHSKCVYSFFYIVIAVPGYIWLLQEGDWNAIQAVLIFCVIVVVSSVILKGFKDGDMEVFIASAPYITLLAYRMKEEVLFVLVLFLFLSVFFSIAGTVVLSIRCGKFIRKNVMVPFIYSALFWIVLLDNLL